MLMTQYCDGFDQEAQQHRSISVACSSCPRSSETDMAQILCLYAGCLSSRHPDIPIQAREYLRLAKCFALQT
jgi:hypothetical protein